MTPSSKSAGSRSTERLFVGIDTGTGGVRAMAVTESGHVAARSQLDLDPALLHISPDLHEQPPEAWWEAVCDACAALMAQIRTRGVPGARLAAVAVDGTSGTLVCLDKDGQPVRPSMMYNDPRGAGEAEELNALGASTCGKLGYRFKSSFALAKLAWVHRNEPAVFERTALVAHQADFIVRRLTGTRAASDFSNALKTGYDLIDERWPEWLDAAYRERLPDVVAPGTRVGAVCPDAAARTGLPEGLAVAAGATDGTAACIASGASRPGDINTTVGTTLVFKAISDRIGTHPDGIVYSHRLPGDRWLPGAASNTGAEWTTALFPGEDLAALDRAAQSRLPSPILAYPLVRQGERFPFLCASAEGFCVPEADDHVDRFAAYLQGTALVERMACEVLEGVIGETTGEVFSTGAASGSDPWLQCRADVTGRVMHRPAHPESAFGSAILAAACVHFPELGEACRRMVRIERTFEPDGANREAYEAIFARFQEELKKRGYL